MFRTARLASIAITAAALAALAGGSPAFAAGAGVDVYACQFWGIAGSVTPGVYSISHAVSVLPLQIPPDHGTFSFTTNGAPLPSVCAAARINSDLRVGAGVATVNINAGGTYDNLVCGTLLTQGPGWIVPSSIVAQAGMAPPLTASSFFQFWLAGGNGLLMATSASNPEGSGGAGTGYVNMVPDVFTPGAGDCVLNDAKQFRVMGAFTIAIPITP